MSYPNKSGICCSNAAASTYDASASASSDISDWLWFLLAAVAVATVVLL